MNHIELSIQATEEQQEQLIAELLQVDCIGFEQREGLLLAYFEEDAFRSYEILAIVNGYDFDQNTIAQKNWNEEWEKDFKPVIVGDFCAVRAHFHPPISQVKYEIIITPKMSFGTGHHATTYMMMEQMKGLDLVGKSVFDFGTGTGILAILAEKLGAKSVTAIDNDLWSIENAKENVANNNCFHTDIYQSADLPSNQQFDVILANINRNIILEYLPALKKALNHEGYIVFSGLLIADEEAIVKACKQQSLKMIKQMEKFSWISLVFVNDN